MNDHVESRHLQQRWEYISQRSDCLDGLEEILNNAGDECWELINVLPVENYWLLVYKRPTRQFTSGHQPIWNRHTSNRLDIKPR